MLVCALETIADLVEMIGTPIMTIYDSLLPPLLSATLHTAPSVRLSAAHCLRSLSQTIPGRACFLANQVMESNRESEKERKKKEKLIEGKPGGT